MNAKIVIALAIFLFPLTLQGQDLTKLPWKHVSSKMPAEWYASDHAKEIAENVLKHQGPYGGWPKNIHFHRDSDENAIRSLQSTGIGGTFDNDATFMEMKFMVNMYARTGDERYRESFLKAFQYILDAQYPNGGWPQFYPVRPSSSVDYSGHITYNDDAMVNILETLRDIYTGDPFYESVKLNETQRAQAEAAFRKGIECILDTQIIVDGKPTVWCAQHDAETLEPAKARSYELESFSGGESVKVVLLLMSLENPSPRIIESVRGAVEWFENHKIENTECKRFRTENGERETEVVHTPGAPPIWARFYDLETEEPFFCDRDGIKKKHLSEIGHERRTGYGWYTYAPQKALDAYPGWSKKISQ